MREAVVAAGRAAEAASGGLAATSAGAVREALIGIAANLRARSDAILAANRTDVAAAEGQLPDATLDRLRMGPERLEEIAREIATLAGAEDAEAVVGERVLADGTRVQERRRPVGVIGANYEARPNVTVDIASQLIKSRNAGVLRTGSAALGSSAALVDLAIAPALGAAGLDRGAVQLLRTPDHAAAHELVSHPSLIPLVILRGSGETTAQLSARAAAHGVRTLAHAEGGGVLYVDDAADAGEALAMIEASLDRLGVCNRLNLLLISRRRYDELLPAVEELLGRMGIEASLPPHQHPRGHEWALDAGNEAHVTVDAADDPVDAAMIANRDTSGLAAGIVTHDRDAAEEFLAAYAGTGAFWNATTRLLDGFKLIAAPETGINVDHVPGPRGPVTYRDLALRQYVVTGPSTG